MAASCVKRENREDAPLFYFPEGIIFRALCERKIKEKPNTDIVLARGLSPAFFHCCLTCNALSRGHINPSKGRLQVRFAPGPVRPLVHVFRWAERDLNPRPPRCKRGALTN